MSGTTTRTEPEEKKEQSNKTETEDSSKGKDNGPENLQGVLEKLVEASKDSDGEQTSVQQVLEAFGNRARGPLLLLPAFLALFPLTGGIPGMSMVTATIIIMVSVGMLFNQKSIWLPGFIKNRSLSHETLQKLAKRSKPWFKPIDWLFDQRLTFLTDSPFTQVIAILCIGLAVTMYPLAFVPLGAAPPSFVLVVLALGITARDGIVVIVGTVLTVASGVLTFFLIQASWQKVQEGLSWLGIF